MLEAIATTAPPFLREAAVGVPEDLQAICLACLSWDPADRPTAQDLVLELRRFLLGEPVRLRPKLYDDLLHRSISEYSNQAQAWERQSIILARGTGCAGSASIAGCSPTKITGSSTRGESLCCKHPVRRDMVFGGGDRVDGLDAAGRTQPALAMASAKLHHDRPAGNRASGPSKTREPGCGHVPGGSGAGDGAHHAGGAGRAWRVRHPAADVSQLFAAFTNQQVLAASPTALAVSVFGLRLLKMTGFAWTTATLVVASFLSFLLLFNWLEKRPEIQALWCLPLVGMELVALLLEKSGRVRWTLPFHLVALLALVVGLDVIAFHGPTLKMLGVARTPGGISTKPGSWRFLWCSTACCFWG